MQSAGELLVVGFEGTRAPEELLARVRAGRVGGVILFARNIARADDGVMVSAVEVAQLVGEIAAAAPAGLPLIVSVDQEGGRVQRLKAPLAVWPPMARLAEAARRGRDADGVARLVEEVGQKVGRELALLGFNVDYAPVLDVHTNPANPVIGDRSFGTTPEEVTAHALAFWRGLESAGVRGCGKHFPGHGDTAQDSHLELPRLALSVERMRAVELAPFAAAVRAGLGMIMTAHVVVPAVDGLPATMSRAWIQGVLRDELGYEGVVVTDDLDMNAVAEHFSVEEVVHAALDAGVDAFLACRDPERQARAEAALERAAGDPMLGPRVAEARARMRRFRSSLRAPRFDAAAIARALPDPESHALAASLV